MGPCCQLIGFAFGRLNQWLGRDRINVYKGLYSDTNIIGRC